MKMNHSPPMKSISSSGLGSRRSPTADQEVGEALADRGREVRRAGAVAGHLPGDRARDPAAVERERRDQVEDQQHDVDAGEVGHHRDERRRPSPRRRRRPRSRNRWRRRRRAIPRPAHRIGDHERHHRPGDRDAELDAGRRRVLRHLRDPAEQPQVDARDRDAVADRHHGVAQLVQQDREEEQQGADRREREGGAVVAARQRRLVVVGQPPDEEEQGEEPARIDSDPDAEDAHERDRPATQHGLMVGGGPLQLVGARRRLGPRRSGPAPARCHRSGSCSDGGPHLGVSFPPAGAVAAPRGDDGVRPPCVALAGPPFDQVRAYQAVDEAAQPRG